ncbi:LamG domain-containing protein [Rathayibacter sp. AY1B5]|uniref:LamG domain-containing protein n=1 Tax=Rathayibacter sp. AY1B5 TaxID=2080530 RepID=UPI000CE91CA9|nr:LamG domain-containing protein [Rathayibacter sp. AY1B5]PPI23821.1 signal peptidase I [Rathayibacter sp. AY1B5]
MSRHRLSAASPAARLRTLLARPRAVAAALAAAALTAVLLTAPATSGAYTASIVNSTNTVGSAAAFFTCDGALAADRGAALFAYTLAQPSGSTTAPDTDSGQYPGTYRSTSLFPTAMVSSAATPKACPRDAGGSWTPNGTNQYLSTPLELRNPGTFSTEIWFKTTNAGGKLFSFSAGATAPGGQYDRHTYIGADGKLVFGVYNGAAQTITSPRAVNDGLWHHVVSTLSPTAGVALWVDGVKVASNSSYRTAENTTGTWKIGYDSLGGQWPNVGSSYFGGSLRYAAVYSTVLTPEQIQTHYAAGR